MDKNGSDFISEYTQSRDALIKTPATAAAVWASFMKFALEWMASGKTLDMGFVKLDPLPLRVGAFEKIAYRYGLRKFYRMGTAGEWKKQLTTGLFVAWDEKHQVIRWRIIATATEAFHRAMIELEKERKPRSSALKYLYYERVKRMLEARKSQHYGILLTYLKEAAYPTRLFRQVGCGQRYVNDGEGHNDPTRNPDGTLRPAIPRPNHRIKRPRRSKSAGPESSKMAVVPADAGVHEVRSVQPPEQDVRNGGSSLEANRQDDAGASGLPVLASIQESTVGKLLEIASDRRDSRMESSVEQLADCSQACHI